MKNPASFLTFTSLSLSVCLLAQYLAEDSMAEAFSVAFGEMSQPFLAAFVGLSRLAHIAYGVFLYLIGCGVVRDKSAVRYFSGFSLALLFLSAAMSFEKGAAFFSAFWSLSAVFSIAVLAFGKNGAKKSVLLLAIPQVLVVAAGMLI